MAAIDTIPNAFWSALNNQNLTDLLPPRWSILVNDAGVQVRVAYAFLPIEKKIDLFYIRLKSLQKALQTDVLYIILKRAP